MSMNMVFKYFKSPTNKLFFLPLRVCGIETVCQAQKRGKHIKKNHKSSLRGGLTQGGFFHQENVIRTLPEYLQLKFSKLNDPLRSVEQVSVAYIQGFQRI